MEPDLLVSIARAALRAFSDLDSRSPVDSAAASANMDRRFFVFSVPLFRNALFATVLSASALLSVAASVGVAAAGFAGAASEGLVAVGGTAPGGFAVGGFLFNTGLTGGFIGGALLCSGGLVAAFFKGPPRLCLTDDFAVVGLLSSSLQLSSLSLSASLFCFLLATFSSIEVSKPPLESAAEGICGGFFRSPGFTLSIFGGGFN